jgi:hypothetical protein
VSRERAFDSAETRHLHGVSSCLDMLDAQRELFDEERSLTRTEQDELSALVQRYNALGGEGAMQTVAASAAAASGPAVRGSLGAAAARPGWVRRRGCVERLSLRSPAAHPVRTP